MRRHGVSLANISMIRSICVVTKLVTFPLGGILGDLFPIRWVLFVAFLGSTVSLRFFQYQWVFASVWFLLLIRVLRSSFNCTWPLLDTVALRFAKRSPQSSGDAASFGRSRLYSSVAWGCSAVAFGYIMDVGGEALMFHVTYAVSFVCVLLIVTHIPTDLSNTNTTTTTETLEPCSTVVVEIPSSPPKRAGGGGTSVRDTTRGESNVSTFVRDFRALISMRGYGVFMASNVVHGVVLNAFDVLLMLWLDDLNASGLISGLAVACSVVLELPVFYYGDYLLRWLGHCQLLCLVHVGTIVRLALNMFVTSANYHWLLMSTQLFHSLTFALYWISAVDENQKWSPVHIRATAHSLLSASFQLCGGVIGTTVWMFLYEKYGVHTAFAGGIVLQLFCLIAQLKRKFPVRTDNKIM